MPASVWFADTVHPILLQGLQKAGFSCLEDYQSSPHTFSSKQIEGIVIRSRFLLSADVISLFPALRWIARIGAGMENIDTGFASKQGIICVNAPEGNKTAVAEHTLAMMLGLTKKVFSAANEIKAGIWKRAENRGTEVEGKTIGILGYGQMGSAFCSRLQGLGAQVLVYDKFKKNFLLPAHTSFAYECHMDELFEKADIVSVHINYVPENHHLVNREWVSQFRKNIYLINTSRGSALKTADMAALLQEGKLLGLALDVFDEESTSFESFSLTSSISDLLKSERVILTPHIAGWSHESNEKMAAICLNKVLALYAS
jgi:D-3-phosphoglycerate dehydrogenase